ncbi:MAG: hypothetical protein N2C14_12495 [Planctomycetales bacterium]
MTTDATRVERWDYCKPGEGSPNGYSYAIRIEGKPGTVSWVKREEDAKFISQLGSAIRISEGGRIIAWAKNQEIADMITRSREDIPSLLTEREWLLKERERLIDRIAELEAKVACPS